MTPRLYSWLGLALTILCVIGCAGERTADVSGVVRYQGKPLVRGIVTFVTPDGQRAFDARITKSGRYMIARVPVGDVQVTVISLKPKEIVEPKDENQEVAENKTSEKSDWFPIPQKYSDRRTSGIVFQVTLDGKELNIELE